MSTDDHVTALAASELIEGETLQVIQNALHNLVIQTSNMEGLLSNLVELLKDMPTLLKAINGLSETTNAKFETLNAKLDALMALVTKPAPYRKDFSKPGDQVVHAPPTSPSFVWDDGKIVNYTTTHLCKACNVPFSASKGAYPDGNVFLELKCPKCNKGFKFSKPESLKQFQK